MKFLPSSILPVVATIVLAAIPSRSHAEPSAIRAHIEASTDKNGNSQSRTLAITISNSAGEPAELKVKYKVFGRDVTSKSIVSVGDGELKATVQARGTEKVTTPAAKAEIVTPKAEKGKPKPEPTGQKIVGHGTQIFQGETLVAEYYEPASMKELFEKAKSPNRGRLAR